MPTDLVANLWDDVRLWVGARNRRLAKLIRKQRFAEADALASNLWTAFLATFGERFSILGVALPERPQSATSHLS